MIEKSPKVGCWYAPSQCTCILQGVYCYTRCNLYLDISAIKVHAIFLFVYGNPAALHYQNQFKVNVKALTSLSDSAFYSSDFTYKYVRMSATISFSTDMFVNQLSF